MYYPNPLATWPLQSPPLRWHMNLKAVANIHYSPWTLVIWPKIRELRPLADGIYNGIIPITETQRANQLYLSFMAGHNSQQTNRSSRGGGGCLVPVKQPHTASTLQHPMLHSILDDPWLHSWLTEPAFHIGSTNRPRNSNNSDSSGVVKAAFYLFDLSPSHKIISDDSSVLKFVDPPHHSQQPYVTCLRTSR